MPLKSDWLSDTKDCPENNSDSGRRIGTSL